MTLPRHPLAAALLAACFASAAGAASAQSVPPAAPDHPAQIGPGMHGPGMPGMDMDDEMHGGMHGFLRGRLHGLHLSEAQQDKLFAIHHAAQPDQRTHIKAIRKAHEALAELAHAERFDDARASALARDLGQAVAAEALLRARTEAQALAVLTPEQRDGLRRHRTPGPQLRPGARAQDLPDAQAPQRRPE